MNKNTTLHMLEQQKAASRNTKQTLPGVDSNADNCFCPNIHHSPIAKNIQASKKPLSVSRMG